MGSIKEKILELRKEGKSYNEIKNILNISKGTISYHCKKLLINNPINGICKLDDSLKKEINEYYKIHTVIETATNFNISTSSVVLYCDKKRIVLNDEEKRDRNYLRVKNRRIRLKKMAVDYKGGKCCKCSYDKCIWALDFHHRNPNEKEFTISEYMTLSWEKLKIELDKCDLICANCHRELHYEEKYAHVV